MMYVCMMYDVSLLVLLSLIRVYPREIKSLLLLLLLLLFLFLLLNCSLLHSCTCTLPCAKSRGTFLHSGKGQSHMDP